MRNGQLIGKAIDIARNYPQDKLSKQAIIHLSKLDGYTIKSLDDPVREYIEYFRPLFYQTNELVKNHEHGDLLSPENRPLT